VEAAGVERTSSAWGKKVAVSPWSRRQASHNKARDKAKAIQKIVRKVEENVEDIAVISSKSEKTQT
jgi:hypothetical protein